MSADEAQAEAQQETTDLAAVQKHWLAIVERHERKRSSWLGRSKRIEKLYADESDKASATKLTERKYNVLWANVETLKPAVYARPPRCVVSRRFQAPSPQLREAVLGLERVTNAQIEDGGLHDAIMSARLDRLLPGRGTIWHRLETEERDGSITDQRVCTDFVGVEDFGHGEGRTWPEVDAVWRRTYHAPDSLKKRFGDDVVQRCGVVMDHTEKDASPGESQATVYEIWCRSKRKVYWIAKNAREALEVGEPPLSLKGFFPCPRPLFATIGNQNCIPTPDYVYYQDQAHEINRLTKRIDRLTDSLKLVGFYPAGPSTEGRVEIERAMSPAVENKLIPIASWAAFSEKGGAGQIVWLPIDTVIKTIQACVELRKSLLNDIYQITGLADIMRGDSDPNETLGAQQLKAQYGSNRLRDTRDDFVRFARDACRIIAEIAAEYFTPEQLARHTGLSAYALAEDGQTPIKDPAGIPVVAPWIQLLKNHGARDVLIDVETDSTVQPDEDAEKQRRTEFMTAFGALMQPMLQLQSMPAPIATAVLPLFGDLMKFVSGGFRAGRELEERIEETIQGVGAAIEAMGQQQQTQAQPPPEDPKVTLGMAKLEQDDRHHQEEMALEAQSEAREAQSGPDQSAQALQAAAAALTQLVQAVQQTVFRAA